ncbi:MAG: hypothetical protein OdinLCB4_006170 [Candidatus Odinarchaeum yellowstonii]|uniref:IFT52 GIFT domain-containing protein n=1 Tax=Odinarchaeota yellowstonii (strain LCB_4) TaxID=1841599 RepID=A0AAF0D1W0_ODILC|nr:MAG: hypothetical protein OdinLCB4_006170 [Candidatus Odinarchaeum yellowstonii]
MSFRNLIYFDESHNEGGRINTTYTGLKELLEKNNFECVALTEFPITYDRLKKCSALVIAGPDMAKFRTSEIEDILKYVYDGGSLVLMSDAGGDSGHMTNLNKIAQPLGFQFNADQVIDQKLNLGVDTVPILEQVTPHDITRGVASISYRAGCSITVAGDAQILFKSNQTSTPPSVPVLVLSNYGKGKTVGIGTYEIFRDRLLGGLNAKHHLTLALNIFQYLATRQSFVEEAEVVVEEVGEESSPLLKELTEIKGGKNLIEADSKQEKVVEAKVTPLIESYTSKEQAAILKAISQDVTNLSASIKEQLYTISDLQEKIAEASRRIEKIALTFKNLDFNQLNDHLNNLSTSFKKIDETVGQLLEYNQSLKAQFEGFKLIQEDYGKTIQSLIDTIKSAVDAAVNKISINFSEDLKLLNTSLKNTVQEILENIILKKLSESLKSQEQRLEMLENSLNEKLNKLLSEFSKKPVVEEVKTQIYRESEKPAATTQVKRTGKRRTQGSPSI